MKPLFYLSLFFIVVSCIETPKDYVTISGTIINKNADSLVITSQNTKRIVNQETYDMEINPEYLEKKIAINPDGTFSDTLKVTKGTFTFREDKEFTPENFFDGFLQLYLDNGFDLQVSLDGKSFRHAASFSGKGEEINTYLIKKAQLLTGLDEPATLKLSQELFYSKRDSVSKELERLAENVKSVKGTDTAFVSNIHKSAKDVMNKVTRVYERVFQKKSLVRGVASPKFTDYENHAGGTTSLDDFKGKYVYIDVWATWCGPCIAQIPYLKEVEKAYHGKNIAFISISVDELRDYNKWKKMVTEKELGGVQLLADAAFKSQFFKDYAITGIPHFILLDTEGNIVDPDAPRPSDEKLKELFEELKI